MSKHEKTNDDKEQIYLQIKTLKYINPFIEQFLRGTNKEVILEVLLNSLIRLALQQIRLPKVRRRHPSLPGRTEIE